MSLRPGILSTARINDKFIAGCAGSERVTVAFVGTLGRPNDVTAHVDAGFGFAPRTDVELAGKAGSLLVADPWHGPALYASAATAGTEVERDG